MRMRRVDAINMYVQPRKNSLFFKSVINIRTKNRPEAHWAYGLFFTKEERDWKGSRE